MIADTVCDLLVPNEHRKNDSVEKKLPNIVISCWTLIHPLEGFNFNNLAALDT